MLTHSMRALPPARVVVLGSRGFVGADLVGRLAESSVPVREVPSSEIDLTLPASVDALGALLRQDDALVFVSALTPDKGRDIATMIRNIQMAQHVCAAIATRPCAHVVYISSDAVYEDDTNPVRETSCTAPTSLHGTMHFVRERMLQETLRAAKMPLVILRASLLYGPGDTHNGYGPNRFVRTAAAERKIALFGGGEEKRDHVFVRDLSRLIELVLQQRSSGVLNVATGTSVSFGDIARVVAGLMGGDVQVVPSPRANPITHRHFDISATIAAFPSFAYTALADGLARSCAGR